MEKEIKSIKTILTGIIIYIILHTIVDWMGDYNYKVECDKTKRIEQKVDSILSNKK